jgi:hypothetical protein
MAEQAGRVWRTWHLVATGFIGLLLGAGIGAAGSGDRDASVSAEGAATTTAARPTVPPTTITVTTATTVVVPTTARPTTTTQPAPATTRATTGIVSIEPAPTTTVPGPKTTFGDGTHRVGIDIAPGTYVAPGGSGCYWERQATFGGGGVDDILANEFAPNRGQVVVTILATDKGFKTSGCGTWRPG